MSKLAKSLTAAAAALTLAGVANAQTTGAGQQPDAVVTPPATVQIQPQEGATGATTEVERENEAVVAPGTDAAGATGATTEVEREGVVTTPGTDAAGATTEIEREREATGATGGMVGGDTAGTTGATTTTEVETEMRMPRADRN